MIKANNRTVILNILTSVTVQIVTIICGFILPKVILNTFGSDVNGLVTSLNQFLSYISLLEGGISGVIMAALYKPIVNKDNNLLSSVINASESFFRKIGIALALYTIGIAVLYPVIVKSDYSFAYISTLTLILSITLFMQYVFAITYKLVLNADGRVYIISIIQIIVTVLNTVLTVVLVKIYPSIHVIKLGAAMVYLLQPVVFNHFVKKEYQIDKNIKSSDKLLAQRWDGFAINIAAFIHNNTDIVVITLFLNLKEVSVYGIYYLVVSGIKRLILAVSQSISPRIGQIYASGDIDKLKRNFSYFEICILVLSFFSFIVGGLCITPFVQLYTRNIHDANYYRPVFGWLLIISEMIFCIREPYVSLAYSANRFKQFKAIAYIEAGLNIILSLILVHFLGIIGIAIGTVASMSFRTIAQILYLHKHILKESYFRLFKGIIVFSIASLIICGLSYILFSIKSNTVSSWLIYCVENCLLASVILFFVVSVFYKPILRLLVEFGRRRRKKHE